MRSFAGYHYSNTIVLATDSSREGEHVTVRSEPPLRGQCWVHGLYRIRTGLDNLLTHESGYQVRANQLCEAGCTIDIHPTSALRQAGFTSVLSRLPLKQLLDASVPGWLGEGCHYRSRRGLSAAYGLSQACHSPSEQAPLDTTDLLRHRDGERLPGIDQLRIPNLVVVGLIDHGVSYARAVCATG